MSIQLFPFLDGKHLAPLGRRLLENKKRDEWVCVVNYDPCIYAYFKGIRLKPGESRRVSFVLGPNDLAFHGRDMSLITEPGDFHVWVGGSSNAELQTAFTLVAEQSRGSN